MDWGAIGAIGEIIGALAVVLSLIYLATQIRVSNSIAKRDSRLQLLKTSREIYSGASDPHALAKVRVKLRNNDAELSPEEIEIATDWARKVYLMIIAVGIAIESNTIGHETRKAYLLTVESIVATYPSLLPILRTLPEENGIRPGYNSWWDEILEILGLN